MEGEFDINKINWSLISNLLSDINNNDTASALDNTGVFSTTPDFGNNNSRVDINYLDDMDNDTSQKNKKITKFLNFLFPQLSSQSNNSGIIKGINEIISGISSAKKKRNKPGQLGAIKKSLSIEFGDNINFDDFDDDDWEKYREILKLNGHVQGYRNGAFESNLNINSYTNGGMMGEAALAAQSFTNHLKKYHPYSEGWSIDPDMVV